jgi:hypothetical protein
MQLSPLNFSGLIQNITQAGNTTETTTNGRVREIVLYECCECYERHEDEDDAAECCAEVSEYTDCPVCKCVCSDHRDATDCCLWKDFDGPTRWAMADKVEAGATWAEVLNFTNH